MVELVSQIAQEKLYGGLCQAFRWAESGRPAAVWQPLFDRITGSTGLNPNPVHPVISSKKSQNFILSVSALCLIDVYHQLGFGQGAGKQAEVRDDTGDTITSKILLASWLSSLQILMVCERSAGIY